jgi:hypothetical protein
MCGVAAPSRRYVFGSKNHNLMETDMRMHLRVETDIEESNKAIKSGKFGEILMAFMEKWKPETAFFTANEGTRCLNFLIQVKDNYEIPVICEPFFFGMKAKITMVPAMVTEDVVKGLAAAEDSIKRWG